ncbi:MMPL family transporter [Frankia gtarii]|uniref:MMPL family transporter n=1 Tax=Frankia gtarii TaxID=2950102 RepID=UPI0021C0C9E7|nr:MMPL family transporter [Frankia gtarii]
MQTPPRPTAVSPGPTAGPGRPPDLPEAGRPAGPPAGADRPTHLAARAARWSVRHRRLAVGGWLLGVILAIVLGSMIGTHTLADTDYSTGQDARAQRILAEHGYVNPADENVLIQRTTPAANPQALLADPQIRSALADVAARVRASGVATALRSPLALPGVSTDTGLVSHDLRSVLLAFNLKGTEDDPAPVEPTLDAVAAVRSAHPGVSVEQFGDASADKALDATVGNDFHHAELLAIPLTLGILLAVFGAVVAAVIPMGLALTAFVGALGLVAFASRLFPTDDTATSVMLLIGLAVGVDYALFYIRREREERAAGHGPQRALEIAAETSGHAVLVSGLTVAASMAGLFITGLSVFTGVAVGTIIVVLVAVLGSLTVLPALLSLLGDRVELLRLPWHRRAGGPVRRRRRARRRDRAGTGPVELLDPAVHGPGDELLARRRAYQAQLARPGIMGRLLRRPGSVAAVAGGLLVLLALPALGMHTAEPGIDDIPKNLPIMKTYNRLSAAFPGGEVAAAVVVSGNGGTGGTGGTDVTTPQVRAAIDALRTRAIASGRMFEPVVVTVTADHRVARVKIPIAGSGTDGDSVKALHTLRSTVIPATIGTTPGLRADVTGTTAGSADFNARLNGRIPLVIGFVMVLAFGLLLAAFRSAVVAAVAVGLNLLSVGAAYGLLVAVFQHHWADGLLGYTSTGAVTNWLPLMLFVVLFGLSMDYQVFVLSRVREARVAGLSMRDAVTVGVRRSAGVVTSAAVIMVAVFSIFATLSQVSMKQLGVGLGAAILIDATVIRVILMPAVLTLLGDRVWRDTTPTSGPGPGPDDPSGPDLPTQPIGAIGNRARSDQIGQLSRATSPEPALEATPDHLGTDTDTRSGTGSGSSTGSGPLEPRRRPRPGYPTPRWAMPPG